MPSKNPRVVLLLLVLLIAGPTWSAEDVPTPEQLQASLAAFAKVGARYEAKTDPVTKVVMHTFQMPASARDTDLMNLPNPPFPFALDLRGTEVKDAGLKELKVLKNLSSLNLFATEVTGAGLKELKDLKNLTSLNLSFTQVTDARLKELAELKNLSSLNLQNTKVTNAGLKELKELKNLTYLDLFGTQVTDAGLRPLREIGLLHALSRAHGKGGSRPTSAAEVLSMDLSDTQVTDAGLKELADLKNLTFLNLSNTKVTDAGLKELREALPSCKVVR
jgi:Leucine-rich repeat (LRR) protein